MKLTDAKVRKAKPAPKEFKLPDGGNLNLHVLPSGGKSWRLAYTFDGKARTLTLGLYPAVTIVMAREEATKARRMIAEGIDPHEAKKRAKAARAAERQQKADTLRKATEEWLEGHLDWSARYRRQTTSRLERFALAELGDKPIATLERQDLLDALMAAEAYGGVPTAHRLRGDLERLMGWAAAKERAPDALVYWLATTAKSALAKRPKERPRAAITDAKEFGKLLRTIDASSATFPVKSALKMVALLPMRENELAAAEWSEFDLEAELWTVPAQRMKEKDRGDHLVPLPRQAIALLRDLHAYSGQGRYVFQSPQPNLPDKPISNRTMLNALRNMGVSESKHCTHGFRASFRSMVGDLGLDADAAERVLAHAVGTTVQKRYDRAARLDARRELLQQWADYLDGLRAGGNVVPLHRGRKA